MRVGLTLSGDNLSEDGAVFAAQLGVTDVVVHFNDYSAGPGAEPYLSGKAVGPILKDCRNVVLWDYETMADAAAMLARHGLRIAALENFSPAFWSDILLDGPNRAVQMEGLKRLVRDAGRAGIPVIGYNFSIAGVWGWRKRRAARGGAMTVVMDLTEEERNTPIPDGMIWNMRYRDGDPAAAPVAVEEAELWERFAWFLKQLVPVAEEAGVRLAAHPDDPPVETLRGTARLVNRPRNMTGCSPSSRATPMRWNSASARSRKCPAVTFTEPRATTLAGRRWPMCISAMCAATCPITSRPSSTTVMST